MCDSTSGTRAYQQFVKFTKFFTTRFIQAVVQSRLGEPVVQRCLSEPDASDWFNIRVDELGEIAAYLRCNISRYPPASSCLTLDFLINTADGDILPLESWCIRFDSSGVDMSVNIRTQLYHQLGTMLKSVIAASRLTPAYRYYVRKQSPDTFIILYRVSEGEPELHLGEEQRSYRIGTVRSPFGSLYVDLAYRTKMEIDQPTRRSDEACASTSSSYLPKPFRTSPPRSAGVPLGVVPVMGGIMEAVSPVSDVISEFSTSPASQSELPFGPCSPQRTDFRLGRSRSSSDDSFNLQQHSTDQLSDEPVFGMESSGSSRYSSSVPLRPSMPQGSPMRAHSFPFAALLTATSSTTSVCSGHQQQLPQLPEDCTDNTGDKSASSDEMLHEMTSLAGSSMHQSSTVPANVNLMNVNGESEPSKLIPCSSSSSQLRSTNDDDDMISNDESFVKVAFADSAMPGSDLGEFVRECRLAPLQLASFHYDDPLAVRNLLTEFENSQETFDRFVSSMQSQVYGDESDL